jgi:gamma-glutamyltranspeptidase / glutathione hydrolase
MAQLVESQFRNNGCVVSYCPIASAIGKRVLNEGGNAVDAAIAVAFALGVTYPQAGNIGGGGFMMIHLDGGATHFLDYREISPRNASPAIYEDPEASVLGAKAAAVPGTVAGLAEALARFGRWSWDRVVSLCIPLAEAGTWVTTRQGAAYQVYEPELERYPSTREAFFIAGRVPAPGHLVISPDLARTYRELAEDGPDAFYRGRVANLIESEVRRGGGCMDLEDLGNYRPVWREPVLTEFRSHRLYTSPLPSTGGFVIKQTIDLIEGVGGQYLPFGSPEYVVLMTRAFRAAYWLRRAIGLDPDHLDAEQAKTIAELYATKIDLDTVEDELLNAPLSAAATRAKVASPTRSTTHFCVLDRDGNAVSNTYSLNTLFGAKLVVSGGGFLLNNSMDDFYLGNDRANWYSLVDGDANLVRGGRRPVSSMAPTLVSHNGRVRLIIGGSGGPRIPTMIAQILLSIDELSLLEAMQTPRIHHQYTPETVLFEPGTPETILAALSRSGFHLREQRALGIGAGIKWIPETNELMAVLDPRFGTQI